MVTQKGANTYVVGITGNFDDAQTAVKKMFNDKELAAELSQAGFQFSSANSINIGRLVPQIVYYVYAYAALVRQNKIEAGQEINIVVPTGNFGNILAAFYAKQMGLPVNKLICASNENKVLFDFFSTGTYNRKRDFILTSSPSMDILISSNLERLLFELSGRDDAAVSAMMAQLKQKGEYSVSAQMQEALKQSFAAGCADEEETQAAIARLWKEKNYCIDTHTAVAVSVYEKYKEASGDGTPTVILSTASPYKFPRAVLTAISGSAPEDEFAAAAVLEAMGVPMPAQIAGLKEKPVLHRGVCAKDAMAQEIFKIGDKR